MKTKQKVKQKIFKNVKEYFELVHNDSFNKDFIEGKTKIVYAGRVFDEKEMLKLVDSALEFWLTSGRFTNEFERKLANFIGIKYASLVNSGSSANLLAISALTSPLLNKRRLLPGDEIITVAAAFPTTVAPIIQNRLVPVFVDIDLGTYNANIEQIKKAISRRTKAIFLAHTLGNPFDISTVKQLCDENKLWLIEDNCDALGSKYNGLYTGRFGDISTSSFYPPHQITLGEGGAVLTNNPALYKIINSLRDWGRDCWCNTGQDNTCGKRFSGKFGRLPNGYDHKYVYNHFGYNFKATDLQAAIGVAQLDKLPRFIKKRRENHRYLYDALKIFKDKIILPEAEKNSQPSWFGFLLTLKNSCKKSRREIQLVLENAKIQTRLLFAGNIIRQPCFSKLRKGRDYRVIKSLENTDKVMKDGFWIGVYPGMKKGMLDFMIKKISTAL
jgi:CDP-6-deoxy-D-xylo-4-hexulose-3-dehydrase